MEPSARQLVAAADTVAIDEIVESVLHAVMEQELERDERGDGPMQVSGWPFASCAGRRPRITIGARS